jgi:hypothetical protein
MSLVAFAMNAFLAVLLIAALAFGWRLERRLKALRDSHEGFAKAVADLDVAAARAEQGLADLRAATDEAAETLALRIERAQALAVQLEERTNRPLSASTSAPPPQSQLQADRPTSRPGREAPAASPADRRLSAVDFERMLDREDRADRVARGEPVTRPASRPGLTNETPRPRARMDDDLFDGPGDSSRPDNNPRAPRR